MALDCNLGDGSNSECWKSVLIKSKGHIGEGRIREHQLRVNDKNNGGSFLAHAKDLTSESKTDVIIVI